MFNIKNACGGDTIQDRNLEDLTNNSLDGNNLTKICPKCGKKYGEISNFCSKHVEEVKLLFEKDIVKYCGRCGAKYTKQSNYCRYCECDDPLIVYISKIKTSPNNYFNFNKYPNSYNEITDFLTQSNIDKLVEFKISESQFNSIIDNIIVTYKQILDNIIKDYNINMDMQTTLDKIFLFAKSFVKTDFKEGGGNLGHFEFNEIYFDDRATDAIQITTLIHELSHFLLAEILEQIVSLLLDTNKTDALEAFVCYLLGADELNKLIDEYCAHTVEGRFAVLGYQDYGSYKYALSKCKNKYGEEYIGVANEIGNTFAHYIKNIMNSYIDDSLRQDIKHEFSKINDVPKYSDLQYETNRVFDWQKFSKAMQIMLTHNIEDIKNNPQDVEKLNLYAVKFKENNLG